MKNVNLFFIRKNVSFFLMMFFSITVIFTLTTSCENESSTDAKIFDAREALNDSDWEKARKILLTLDPNDEVLQYLSNAYAGEVGINTFDLITTINELDEEGKSGSIDMIGKLIGDEDDFLSYKSLTNKLTIINNAIESINKITELPGVKPDVKRDVKRDVKLNFKLNVKLDDDQTVQLGLASITRIVIIIAKLIYEQTGSTEIQMTEEWITDDKNKEDFYPISYDSWNSSEILDSEGEPIHYSTMLMEDIENVGNAVSVMSDGNDIQDDFNAFKLEIDNGFGDDSTAGDDEITLKELNHYIDKM